MFMNHRFVNAFRPRNQAYFRTSTAGREACASRSEIESEIQVFGLCPGYEGFSNGHAIPPPPTIRCELWGLWQAEGVDPG